MVLNALGTLRNTFKSQQSVKKKHKIGEIGNNRKNLIFFLMKMVSNALGTQRNTFKSQKLNKNPLKSGKFGLGTFRSG